MVTAPTPAQREDYEERAAIIEFEANLPRPEAERLAALACFPRPHQQGELFTSNAVLCEQNKLRPRRL